MEKTIVRRRHDPAASTVLENLHPVLQRVYSTRGIQSSDDIARSLEHLLPFQQLMNIDKAVARLYTALNEQQRILIVGDFDADGATSTALAVSALRAFGATAVHYIVPNRFEYGYGLTPEIVLLAAQSQPDLIITVDNGISSCAGVDKANELGIEVLITDHHLPGANLPQAVAIVNPNQVGDEFPSKNLAGVGVIFYVMLALRSFLREKNWFASQQKEEPNLAQFLDLVALGTVADVVPLDRNNRLLVHQGIARIRSGKARPGIRALLEIGGRSATHLVAADLSFSVAPRLNAAGRLEDMSLGIEGLLSEDPQRAKNIAKRLDELNEERRDIEAKMQQQALVTIDKAIKDRERQGLAIGLCLFDPEWHQGVIGIVAGRIKDRFHRPVIAFAAVGEGELKGSARSIPGLHIRDTFDAIACAHPQLMDKFGGHAMAAGLTIKRENYEQFAAVFDREVRRSLSEQDLADIIHSDGELTHDDFTLTFAQLLREAGPWGQSFPEPLFDGHFNVVEQRLVGGKHLKLTLMNPGQNRIFDGIAFNIDLNKWPNHRCETVHAAYRLDINEYRGQRNLQLVVEYLAELETSR